MAIEPNGICDTCHKHEAHDRADFDHPETCRCCSTNDCSDPATVLVHDATDTDPATDSLEQCCRPCGERGVKLCETLGWRPGQVWLFDLPKFKAAA